MCFAMHLPCLFSNGNQSSGMLFNGDDRRFIHHHFFIVNDQRVSRTQIDGELLLEQADRMLVTLLVGSFVVLLPLTFLVAIASASRWAGPLVRLERFLREVARGESPEDLKLRRGDELQDLARLLNEATAPLRDSQKGRAPGDAPLAGESERKAA